MYPLLDEDPFFDPHALDDDPMTPPQRSPSRCGPYTTHFAGFAALIRKCAFAAAAAGLGIGLTLIGYRENAEQSAQTVFLLKILFGAPPTLLLLGALVAFRRFPLTRDAHAKVVSELNARHEAREQAAKLPEAA